MSDSVSPGSACNGYFHDLESRERGKDDRPGRSADLCSPTLPQAADDHANFQANEVAFDVSELRKGLLSKIDGFLDPQRSAGVFVRQATRRRLAS